MINIREMQIEDFDQVMAIENVNFSEPWTEAGFFTFFIRDDTLFLVAEEEGKIKGYIGIVCVIDEGDITNVSVDPKEQGRGIGNMLVEAVVKKARERGVKNIFLEVRRSNAPAIRVYEKNGFVQISVRKGYYTAPLEDALIMKREDG